MIKDFTVTLHMYNGTVYAGGLLFIYLPPLFLVLESKMLENRKLHFRSGCTHRQALCQLLCLDRVNTGYIHENKQQRLIGAGLQHGLPFLSSLCPQVLLWTCSVLAMWKTSSRWRTLATHLLVQLYPKWMEFLHDNVYCDEHRY